MTTVIQFPRCFTLLGIWFWAQLTMCFHPCCCFIQPDKYFYIIAVISLWVCKGFHALSVSPFVANKLELLPLVLYYTIHLLESLRHANLLNFISFMLGKGSSGYKSYISCVKTSSVREGFSNFFSWTSKATSSASLFLSSSWSIIFTAWF